MLDDSPEMSVALPPWSARGSGDLRADRRYGLAREELAAGDAEAAADLARQALELVPGWPPAWLLLGEAERLAGRLEPAIEAFRGALARDPEDRLGAGLHLASLGARDPGSAMSPAYVAALFDDYAPRFDAHLTGTLGYRGPQDIVALLSCIGQRSFTRVLDVGCGTGLMGEALAGMARRIEGCDLSPAMVELARRRGCYADVALLDGAAFLAAQQAGSADLVTAADVLVYVGDPRPLLSAAAGVLQPGGHVALTLQTGPAEGLMLGEDMRFRHAPAFIAAIGASVGLPVVAEQAITIRLDRGVPLPGAVILCRRAGA